MAEDKGSALGTADARRAEDRICNDPAFARYYTAFRTLYPSSPELLEFLDKRQTLWGWRTAAQLIKNGEIEKVHRLVVGLIADRQNPA